MRLPTALVLVFGLLAFANASGAASVPQCLNGLRPALIAGDFSGSVDCWHDQLTLNHVGYVRKFSRTFEIYSYHYLLRPACRECAVHGGHRIIFMERGRYIGQYRSDFARVTIRNGQLILQQTGFPGAVPVTVRFTPNGPAKTQWDGADVLDFFR